MSRDEPAHFWRLVEQLMLRGWYRAGQILGEGPERRTWGFREGHLTDVHGATELKIAATSEADAMRILLDELKQNRITSSVGDGSEKE